MISILNKSDYSGLRLVLEPQNMVKLERSPKKVMTSVFWNATMFLLTDYLEKGEKIDPE